MKFYDRESELKELRKLFAQAKESAKMTVLTGRRRVGKTLLALEFAANHKFIYFFVSRKSEPLLCLEYLDEIKKKFDVPVLGDIRDFKTVFALLLEISRRERFTLIVDEFQEFYNINPAVYSEMQHLWDLHKQKSKLNLILIGSVYSLMHKIFESSKEPLFGRADRILFIKPFSIPSLNEILADYNAADAKTLFDVYVITGGMPRYLDILATNSALSYDRMLSFIFEANSPFMHEGKTLLIEEFGKEYSTYFSILELIATGKTARTEIESILERNVGGFLERLENDYFMVTRHKPINAKPNARLQKYAIADNFLNFWFRFIYRNRSAVETGNLGYIKDLVQRDYANFCGKLLEKFFRELLANTGRYNQIGSYWEKDNQNEIDLVALNDAKKEIVIAEVKLNKAKINLEVLKQKSPRLLAAYPKYKPTWLGLSLNEVKNYL